MAAEEGRQDLKHRQYRGVMAAVVSAIAVTFSVYHILYVSRLIERLGIYQDIPEHLAIHVGLILSLVYLLVPLGTRLSHQRLPWYDVVLLFVGVGWNLYMLVNFDALRMRGTLASLETYEVIGSWLNMLVILEAARRLTGAVVAGIVAFFLVYALFSDYFPGFLRAAGHDWVRVGRSVGLFATGMYGSLLYISATVLVSFILFAQFLFVTGAGQWFVNLAQAVFGHVRGGPAKVAVVGSGLIGTISGSAVVNVATVGVFTIPLMKTVGYKPHFAGAVEAAASNGGQIMPPVMGIAAFIMVDFLQVPYSRIILAALLPALAYYAALFLMVDFEAARAGLRGSPRSECPELGKTLMQGWQFMLPLATLVVLLIFFGYSAELSALYATAVLIVIGLVNKGNRLTLKKTYIALKSTAIDMMLIAVAISAAAILVGSVQLSGLSYRLSMGLVAMAGGNVWLLLLLTAVACLVLGMGMTTAAVYVTMATLVAPALVAVGFIPLAAHFYVFYFGVAALITPPVCPAAFVAAGIAGADPMRTGLSASRLAVVTFLAPLIFLFEPAFLMEGSATSILLTIVYVSAAIVPLAGGLSGYLFGNRNVWWRILLIGSALLIVYPEQFTRVTGVVMAVSAVLAAFMLSRLHRQPQTVATTRYQ